MIIFIGEVNVLLAHASLIRQIHAGVTTKQVFEKLLSMVAASVGILSVSGNFAIYLFFILFLIPWILLVCRLAVKAWLLDLIFIVWIEDEYIFIKGVNQEYISEFPEWSDYSDFSPPIQNYWH